MTTTKIGLERLHTVTVHYASSTVSSGNESDEQDSPDHDHHHVNLAFHDLQNEEIIYQLLLECADGDRIDNGRQVGNFGSSSRPRNLDAQAQVAYDEALAWQLHEMQKLSIQMHSEEQSEAAAESSTTRNRREVTSRSDDVDPDGMTYEDRLQLEEEIGVENRGLSDELISYLGSSKYKCGIFSKKDRRGDECTICLQAYKNGNRLITLPSCRHSFHARCIAPWLKINKACPVCKEEVFG